MDNFEFCKEHYFFEINRKHQLTNALALPIGLLTVIGGILAYYLKHLVYSGGIVPVLYSALVVVALYFVGKTVYYLICSYHDYTYSYIATPDELLDYHKNLIQHHANNISQADDDLHDYVLEQYSKKASINTWNNDSKSEYLHEANTNLIYSLILILLISAPYFYLNNHDSEKVYKVELTNNEILQLKR